jgi:hypothetical protein
MISQYSLLCISGWESNATRKVSSTQETKAAAEGWSAESAARNTGHRVSLELSLTLFRFLTFAEMRSLSVFEGLINYSVDVFLSCFLNDWALGSVSFHLCFTLRVKENNWK